MKPLTIELTGAKGISFGLGIDTLKLDLSKLHGLVAITGPNGAGKTTFIENLTPFPRLASREGALAKHFNLKASKRDLAFIYDGILWRSLLLIDALTGKSEGYLYRDGSPLNDGRISTYKDAVSEVFGSEELFFRSMFRAQNAESIASLTAGELKKIFMEMFALGRYEIYSMICGKQAQALEISAESIRAANEFLLKRTSELESLKADRDFTKHQIKELQQTAEQVKVNVLETEKTVGLNTAANAAANEQMKGLEENQRRLALNGRERDDEEAKHKLEKAAGEAEVEEMKREIEFFEHRLRDDAILRKDLEELEVLEEDEARFKQQELAASVLVGKRSEVQREAGLKRQALMKGESTLRETKSSITSKIQKLQATIESDHTMRLQLYKKDLQSSVLIDEVPCKSVPSLPDQCKLLAGARSSRANAEQLKAKIDGFNPEAAFEERGGSALHEERNKIDAELKEVDAQRVAIDDGTEEMLSALGEPQELDQDGAARRRLRIKELVSAKDEIAQLDALKTKLPLKQEALSKASQQLEREIDRNRNALKRILLEEKELRDAREMMARGLPDEITRSRWIQDAERLAAAKRDLESLQAELKEHGEQLARLEARIEEALKAQEEIKISEAKLVKCNEASSAWRFLQKACSPDGIPALELDQAAPEISQISNDLLDAAFGTAFQISFETTRKDAKGKRDIEDFLVRVFNQEGERTLEDLSGGERIWIEKAIGEAFGICLARRSDKKMLTSFVDEMDGALDAESRERFVQMLKRSHEIGGRELTMLITHSRELWNHCEQRIEFDPAAGKVEVFS